MLKCYIVEGALNILVIDAAIKMHLEKLLLDSALEPLVFVLIGAINLSHLSQYVLFSRSRVSYLTSSLEGA